MTILRRHARLPWIALAAIVGILSVDGRAAACSAEAASGPAKTCCAKRIVTPCGCCEVGTTSDSHIPGEWGEMVIGEGPVALPAPASCGSIPGSPCECRSDVPASPSRGPESRTTEVRGEKVVDDTVHLRVIGDRPASLLTKLVSPNSSPARSPLFLRTSRLLI